MIFRETAITNPGPANFVQQIAKRDSRRVLLVVAARAGVTISITTNPGGLAADGLALNNNEPNLPMPLRDYGMMIQMDWYNINATGAPTTFTVFELFAETAAEMSAEDYGAGPFQRIPVGLQFGELPEFKPMVPARDYYAELRDRVKGAIWRKTKGRNGAEKSWVAPSN